MFSRIIYTGALGGLIAGLLFAMLEVVLIAPMIQQAEQYEQAQAMPTAEVAHQQAHAHVHEQAAHAHEHETPSELNRHLYTGMASILMGIGYALLLAVCFTALARADWKTGLGWGLAGYVVFQLAPALGLPPELPGMPAADISVRQWWWLGTVLATAAGLWALLLSPKTYRRLAIPAGLVLLALPHLIGSPQPPALDNPVPAQLLQKFTITVLLATGLFWLVLGIVSGHMFNRLGASKAHASPGI